MSLEHKGYTAGSIEFDEDQGQFDGIVPELHRKAALQAVAEGISLNQ